MIGLRPAFSTMLFLLLLTGGVSASDHGAGAVVVSLAG